MEPDTAGPLVWVVLVVVLVAAILCLVAAGWARSRHPRPPGRARPLLLLVLLMRPDPSQPGEKPQPDEPDEAGPKH